MDSAELNRRLLETFLLELRELRTTFEEDLLDLERSEAEDQLELFQRLFRAAHTLKGAARAVNVDLLAQGAHALEDLLDAARSERLTLDAPALELLLQSADALSEVGRRLEEGTPLAGARLEGLIPHLRATAAGAPAPTLAHGTRGADPEPVPTRPSEPTTPGRAPEPPSTAQELPPLPASPAQALEPSGGILYRVSASQLHELHVLGGELLFATTSLADARLELDQLSELSARCCAEWDPLGHFVERSEGGGPGAQGLEPGLALRPPRAEHAGREHLEQLSARLDRLRHSFEARVNAVCASARTLEDGLRELSMVPLAEACAGLRRSVRDLCRDLGKQAELRFEGTAVRVDAAVVQRLRGPLLHLLRNAVDHGLETTEERRVAGKPALGRVTVSASLLGARVRIRCSDDGRGLDLPAIREQARGAGLTLAGDPTEALFTPGFSTRASVTQVSGRGVGLNVVKTDIEALQGTVQVESSPGAGTTFTLTLPVTLSTAPVLIVEAAGQLWGLLLACLEGLVNAPPEDLPRVAGRPHLRLGDALVPVASLAQTLGRSDPRGQGALTLAVLAAGTRRVAFSVDACLTEREAVIKSLGPRLQGLPHLLGGTVLGDGRVALVLNAAGLIQAALRTGSCALAKPPPRPPTRGRVLVADDSLTTRSLWKTIIEGHGYQVELTADGEQAWEALQTGGGCFDAVVSDVEMPRRNGFELTQAIRRTPHLEELPVILVTSMATEVHRIRGAQVGADAYLVKSTFDQSELLETLDRLTGGPS